MQKNSCSDKGFWIVLYDLYFLSGDQTHPVYGLPLLGIGEPAGGQRGAMARAG